MRRPLKGNFGMNFNSKPSLSGSWCLWVYIRTGTINLAASVPAASLHQLMPVCPTCLQQWNAGRSASWIVWQNSKIFLWQIHRPPPSRSRCVCQHTLVGAGVLRKKPKSIGLPSPDMRIYPVCIQTVLFMTLGEIAVITLSTDWCICFQQCSWTSKFEFGARCLCKALIREKEQGRVRRLNLGRSKLCMIIW